MKTVKFILLVFLAVILFSSCTERKVYTLKSVSGFITETDMDLSQYKVGDTILLLKYPGDIKHNEYVELTILSVK